VVGAGTITDDVADDGTGVVACVAGKGRVAFGVTAGGTEAGPFGTGGAVAGGTVVGAVAGEGVGTTVGAAFAVAVTFGVAAGVSVDAGTVGAGVVRAAGPEVSFGIGRCQ